MLILRNKMRSSSSKDIMEIVRSLEESSLLIKSDRETIENKAKEK